MHTIYSKVIYIAHHNHRQTYTPLHTWLHINSRPDREMDQKGQYNKTLKLYYFLLESEIEFLNLPEKGYCNGFFAIVLLGQQKIDNWYAL